MIQKHKAMKMSTDDLKKMQAIQLDLLLEVDRICRKNNIKYCIMGGTLLGAVRHKGVIPWDDDIDIGMIRSEYEKFVIACKKDLDKKKYFLQDFNSDKYYRWGYSKLLRKGTTYVRTGQEALKMKKAVFADIFVFDGMPNNYILERIHCFLCFSIRKVLWSPVGKRVSSNVILRMWYELLSLIPRDFCVRMVRLLSRICPVRKKSEWVRPLTFPVKYKRKWLTQLIEIEFEGYKVYAPKDTAGPLIHEYGDYMKLPPESERVGHLTAAYFDFGDI